GDGLHAVVQNVVPEWLDILRKVALPPRMPRPKIVICHFLDPGVLGWPTVSEGGCGIACTSWEIIADAPSDHRIGTAHRCQRRHNRYSAIRTSGPRPRRGGLAQR